MTKEEMIKLCDEYSSDFVRALNKYNFAHSYKENFMPFDFTLVEHKKLFFFQFSVLANNHYKLTPSKLNGHLYISLRDDFRPEQMSDIDIECFIDELKGMQNAFNELNAILDKIVNNFRNEGFSIFY